MLNSMMETNQGFIFEVIENLQLSPGFNQIGSVEFILNKTVLLFTINVDEPVKLNMFTVSIFHTFPAGTVQFGLAIEVPPYVKT